MSETKHPSEMSLPELYLYMKANPNNREAQLCYYKALADARLADFYTMVDENEKLQGKLKVSDKLYSLIREIVPMLGTMWVEDYDSYNAWREKANRLLAEYGKKP